MKLLIEKVDDEPELSDPSEEYRPELVRNYLQGENKTSTGFRDYENDENKMMCKIRKTYEQMHSKQTVEFVQSRHKAWLRFDHMEAGIMEALEMLNDLVDESDPDTDVPNIVHAFQTAERIRKVYPDLEWMQITGLVHDLGKVMAFFGEPQWAVVGDTFPVGCKPQKSIVFRNWSFEKNPDIQHDVYSKDEGMYEKNCGLDKLLMSWGHDEYLYHVLKNHGAKLPSEGLNMIRFHSFYPWHTGGDYRNFMNKDDEAMLKWIKEFNKFDLYTKSDELPDIEALKPYYQNLIDKYIPGNVKF